MDNASEQMEAFEKHDPVEFRRRMNNPIKREDIESLEDYAKRKFREYKEQNPDNFNKNKRDNG